MLQDFSTQPTHIGDLALHRSSALGLYNLVANHSPNVKAVMYETWARAPSHPFYTGGSPLFPGGPAQMQQEVRDGYHLSTGDINTAAGMNVATFAPVGDAWENAGFPLTLYGSDLYHAQNRGTLLNALVLYGTIYEDHTTSDINLSGLLSILGISAADGAFLTSVADATLVPDLPGDFNHDGTVDAADYVMWRKTNGTQAGYDTWWAHFGELVGSGSGAGANTTVPEPTTLVRLIVSAVGIRLWRRKIS